MNERIKKIHQRLLNKDYHQYRRKTKYNFSEEFSLNALPFPLRSAEQLYRLVDLEEIHLYPGDRLGLFRTIKYIPDYFTEEEYSKINNEYFIFDGGVVGNISSDYEYTLRVGFDKRLEEINNALSSETDEEKIIQLQAMKRAIEAVYLLSDKYQAAAKANNPELYAALSIVPRGGAQSFYQAILMLRIMNYMLWLNKNKHNTLGRFDQYLYPYYKMDIENNLLDYQGALEIVEEFFISLNFDNDLYPGIQQGDNGQSLVLGGSGQDGKDGYNELSKICLDASLNLKLIDPKINMRVNKDTPDYWYQYGTMLTKQGLGFPQYSNDDIVIPALVKMGYDIEDAKDYVVAACWEFIIPKVGMDIPNIDALSFPLLVQRAIINKLEESSNYKEFEDYVYQEIEKEVKRMVGLTDRLYIFPSPFQSILMRDCLLQARDISRGAKYNNFGFHGAGIASATDAMAAVKKYVFLEEKISAKLLIEALENDFKDYEEIQNLLAKAPKMGNNDDFVDDIAKGLLHSFSSECRKHINCRGGIFRPGTGTAMYYIWLSQSLGATADGRNAKQPFSANYSPSLNINMKGVLSVIQSFCKPDLKEVCNGGPLTLEFHNTVFRNEEGSNKVANLVKTFILLGGHQLQLNALNKEALLDAQKHPEKHKNLIVRVWGWSGYFNELDPVYQNHVIKRLDFIT